MQSLYTFNEDKTMITEYRVETHSEVLDYMRDTLKCDIASNNEINNNEDTLKVKIPEDLEYVFRLLYTVWNKGQSYSEEQDNLLMSNAYLEGITGQNLDNKLTGYLVFISSILEGLSYEKVADHPFSEVGKLIGKENASPEEIKEFFRRLNTNAEWLDFLKSCAEKRENIYQTARMRP